jgi:hypothetical protein
MKTVSGPMLTLVILLAGVPCLAQSQDSSAGAPAAAKPAPAPAATAKATPLAADKKKTKKVWTNDNVSSIPGGVSVVGEANQGDASAASRKDTSSGTEDVRQKQIAGYRDQIRQMQAQIDAADKRIAQLKNFKAEDTSPSGGINMNQGYNMVPLEDQVKQLEDKKKQLQAKIEDVENEARKNGIDSGDLR